MYESRLTALTRLSQGKVRDIYAVDDRHLLIITTDRLSAFDVVLPDPIPGKGEVLTTLSNFWFARTAGIVPNHLANLPLDAVISDPAERAAVATRATVVRRLKPLPIEAVVRGYLIGSGYKDYQATGKVCGIQLPAGLPLAAPLPEPLFTPATKAAIGDHDENISFAECEKLVGADLARQVRTLAIRVYSEGAAYATKPGHHHRRHQVRVRPGRRRRSLPDRRGDDAGFLAVLAAAEYRTGISPPSFDKQFVRDYLETLDWNKKAPGPRLPPDVIRRTTEKYRQALELLTAWSCRPGGRLASMKRLLGFTATVSRRVLRQILQLLVLVAGACLVLVLGYTLYAVNMLPDLQPWHTERLDGEFSALTDRTLDFAGYQALEARLLANTAAAVRNWSGVGEPFSHSRFNPDGNIQRLAAGAPYNRSFRLTPAAHASGGRCTAGPRPDRLALLDEGPRGNPVPPRIRGHRAASPGPRHPALHADRDAIPGLGGRSPARGATTSPAGPEPTARSTWAATRPERR